MSFRRESGTVARESPLNNRVLSDYQKYVRDILVEIGGVPYESMNLSSIGPNIKVWIWRIGKKSKRKESVLVMADKAQDLGLQVYRIGESSYWDYKSSKRGKFSRYEIAQELNLVSRVAVWCPESA